MLTSLFRHLSLVSASSPDHAPRDGRARLATARRVKPGGHSIKSRRGSLAPSRFA